MIVIQEGCTKFLSACRYGNLPEVQNLVEKGDDINAHDNVRN